jgi:hypothetical protein
MRLRWFFLGALAAVGARGDQVTDLVRAHVEALGGIERIEALTAMRATGQVVAGGKRVRFTLTAARPDRVRLETENGARTLVQGTDGKEGPWEFDTGSWPPRYRVMPESAARGFAADAEFDDPLVAGAARGYAFDFGGETTADGRKMTRLLVTKNLTETFAVLLDLETKMIVLRVESRTSAGGRTLQVLTRYDDYRTVEGVMLPHRVTVIADGAVKQQTVIERIDANPALTAETFARPKAGAPARK